MALRVLIRHSRGGVNLKLRVELLALKEPNDWEMPTDKAGEVRKGTTYKISVLIENGDATLVKVTEEFYKALRGANFKRFAVIDIVYEARVVLEVNSRGRAEQNLKITPVGFEWVADSIEDLKLPAAKAS